MKGELKGTYRYMGTWEMIDQVIVSKELLMLKKDLLQMPDMLKILQT